MEKSLSCGGRSRDGDAQPVSSGLSGSTNCPSAVGLPGNTSHSGVKSRAHAADCESRPCHWRRGLRSRWHFAEQSSVAPSVRAPCQQQPTLLRFFRRRQSDNQPILETKTPREQARTGRSIAVGGEDRSLKRTLRQCQDPEGSCTRSPDLFGVASPRAEGPPKKGQEASKDENSGVLPFSLQEEEKVIELISVGSSSDESDVPASGNKRFQSPSFSQQQSQEKVREKSLRSAPFPSKDVRGNESRDACPVSPIRDLSVTPATTKPASDGSGEPSGSVTTIDVEAGKQNHVPMERQLSMFASRGTSAQSRHPASVLDSTSGTGDLSSAITAYAFATETVSKASVLSCGVYDEDRKRKRTEEGFLRVVVPRHQPQGGFLEKPDVAPGPGELTRPCREDVEGEVVNGGPCKILVAVQDPPTTVPSTGSAVVSMESRRLLHASQVQELEGCQAFHGSTETTGAHPVHRGCASLPWRWAFLVPVSTCLEASCSYNAHLFSPTEMRLLRVLARAVGIPNALMEDTGYLPLHVVNGNSAAFSLQKRSGRAHHEGPVCDEEKESTDTIPGTERPSTGYPRSGDSFSHQSCHGLIQEVELSMERQNGVSRSCLQSVAPGKQHLDCRRLLPFSGLLVETAPADVYSQGRLNAGISYSACPCRGGYLEHDDTTPQSAAAPHFQSRVAREEVASKGAAFVSSPASAGQKADDAGECVLPVESCVRGRRHAGQVIIVGPDVKSSNRSLLTGDDATTHQRFLELPKSLPRYSADAPLPAGARYLLCRLLVFLARKGSLREVDFGLPEIPGKVFDRSAFPQRQGFSEGRAFSSGGLKSKVETQRGSHAPPDEFLDMGVHHAGQARDAGSLLRRVTPSAAPECDSCAGMGTPRVWLRLHPFLERSRREVTDPEAAVAELQDRGLITLWKWEDFPKVKEEDCEAESSEQETQTEKSSHFYGGGTDDMSGAKAKTQEQPRFLRFTNASGEHGRPSTPVREVSAPRDACTWVPEPPTVARGLDIDGRRRRMRGFACDIVGALHCLTVPELQRVVSVVVASIRPSPPASLHTFHSTLRSAMLRPSPFSPSCPHFPSPRSSPVPSGTPRFLTLSVPVTSRIGRLLPLGLLPCTEPSPTQSHCGSKLGAKEKELPVVYRKKSDCLGFLLAVTQTALLDSCGELEGRDFPLLWSPPSSGVAGGIRGSARRTQEASKMKKLTHFFEVAPRRRSPGSTTREGGRQEQPCRVGCVHGSPPAGKEAAVLKSGKFSSPSPGALIPCRHSDGEILLRLLQGAVLYIVGGLLCLQNAELLQAWRAAYFSFHVIHTTSSTVTSRLFAPPGQYLLWGDTSVLTDEDSSNSEAETTTVRRQESDGKGVGQRGEKRSNAKDDPSGKSRQSGITCDRGCEDEMKVRDAKTDGEVQASTIAGEGNSNCGCSPVVDARQKDAANRGKVEDSIQKCSSPHSKPDTAARGESPTHEEGQSEGECGGQRGKNWLGARRFEDGRIDHKRSPRSAIHITKSRERTILRASQDGRRQPERFGIESPSPEIAHTEDLCRRQRKESSILACVSAVISPAVIRLTNLVLQQLHLKLPQRERRVLNHAESQRQTVLCRREDCRVLPTSVSHSQQTGVEDLLACREEEGETGQRDLHAPARQEDQDDHLEAPEVLQDRGRGGSCLFPKCGSHREAEWISLAGSPPVFRCVCSICTLQREKGCVFRSRTALLTYAYAKLEKWRLGAMLWKGAGGRRLPSIQKAFDTQDDEPVEVEVLRMADKAAKSLLKYVRRTETLAVYCERGQHNTSDYLPRHAVWETGAQEVGEETTLGKGSWAGRMTHEREEYASAPSLATVKRGTAIRKKVFFEKKEQGRTAECEKHETLQSCSRGRQELADRELRNRVRFREDKQEESQSSARAFKQCDEDVERRDEEEIPEGPLARRGRYGREEEKKGGSLQLGEICERTKELRLVSAARCPPSDFIRFTPQFVWSVSISQAIELLEQRKQHETAVKLLKLLIRFYQLQEQLSRWGQQKRYAMCAFLSDRGTRAVGCYRRLPRWTEEIQEGCRSAESEVREVEWRLGGSVERRVVWDCEHSVDGTRDMSDDRDSSVTPPFINCRQVQADVANGEEVQGEMPLRSAACTVFTRRLGKWYNRLMVLLKVHLKRPEEALVAAVACLREPSGAVSLAERLEISRRATGLARTLFSPDETGQGRAEANKKSAAVRKCVRTARRSTKAEENEETASEWEAEEVLTDTTRRGAGVGKKNRGAGRQKGSDVREVGAEEGKRKSEEGPVRLFTCWEDILLRVIERSTASLSCCETPLFLEDLCIYSSVFRRDGEDIPAESLRDRVARRQNRGDNSVAIRSKRSRIKKKSPVLDSSSAADGVPLSIPPWFALFPQDVQRRLLEAKEYQELLRINLPHTVVYARPLEAGQQSGKASVFFGWDGSLVGVEDLCLQHYAMAGGWQGIHDEGRILRMLFRIMIMCQDTMFLKRETIEENNLKDQEDEKSTYKVEEEEKKNEKSGQAGAPDKNQVVEEEARRSSASGVAREGKEQLFRGGEVTMKDTDEVRVAFQGALYKRSDSGRPGEGDGREGTRSSRRGMAQQRGRNNPPPPSHVREAFLYSCKLEETSTNARVLKTPLDGKSDALGSKEEDQTQRTTNRNNVLFGHGTMGLYLPCRSVSVASPLFPISLLPLSEPCPSFHSPGTSLDHCREVGQMPWRRSLCLEENIYQQRIEEGQGDEDTYTAVVTGNEVTVGMRQGQAETSEDEASPVAGVVKLGRCSSSPPQPVLAEEEDWALKQRPRRAFLDALGKASRNEVAAAARRAVLRLYGSPLPGLSWRGPWNTGETEAGRPGGDEQEGKKEEDRCMTPRRDEAQGEVTVADQERGLTHGEDSADTGGKTTGVFGGHQEEARLSGRLIGLDGRQKDNHGGAQRQEEKETGTSERDAFWRRRTAGGTATCPQSSSVSGAIGNGTQAFEHSIQSERERMREACARFFGKIAHGMGGQGLRDAFRLLSQDFAYWAGGLPDLLLWRDVPGPVDKEMRSDGYEGKTSVSDAGDHREAGCGARREELASSAEVRFVEVKGPRDRLSEKQRCWLAYFLKTQIACEVCKVLPPPVLSSGLRGSSASHPDTSPVRPISVSPAGGTPCAPVDDASPSAPASQLSDAEKRGECGVLTERSRSRGERQVCTDGSPGRDPTDELDCPLVSSTDSATDLREVASVPRTEFGDSVLITDSESPPEDRVTTGSASPRVCQPEDWDERSDSDVTDASAVFPTEGRNFSSEHAEGRKTGQGLRKRSLPERSRDERLSQRRAGAGSQKGGRARRNRRLSEQDKNLFSTDNGSSKGEPRGRQGRARLARSMRVEGEWEEHGAEKVAALCRSSWSRRQPRRG